MEYPSQYNRDGLNGRFTASQTVVNALSEGHWGSFYESIAHDVYVTPDYLLGNVVSHDAASKSLTLAHWRSRGSYHFPEALPAEKTVTYDDNTRFMVEDRLATAEEVLERSGDVVQVHPPRQQIILLETAASAFDPSVLPVKGGRGDANAASTNAVLVRWTPKEMIFRDEAGTEFSIERLGSTRLDGKCLVGGSLLLKPGRHAALVFYRGGGRDSRRPVQTFFRTMDDEIRGTISAVSGSTLTIATIAWDGSEGSATIDIDPAGISYLDGVAGAAAPVVGQRIRVFPQRPQTVVALLKRSLITNGSTRKPKILAEGYLPVASFRAPQRIVGTAPVTLDAQSSYAIDGSISSYSWTFSDGKTAEGPTVTHSFAADGHASHHVTLTVTDDRGHKATTIKHLVATTAAQPAVKISADALQPGLTVEGWGLGKSGAKAIAKGAKPGELMTGDPAHKVVIAAMDGGDPALKSVPRATSKRLTGYLQAPSTGWYTVGAYFKNILWINEQLVLDGQTGGRSEGQRSWVHLEAGLHAIRFETAEESSKARFTWMHPDGARVVPTDAAADASADLMYRTYRPMGALLFHE